MNWLDSAFGVTVLTVVVLGCAALAVQLLARRFQLRDRERGMREFRLRRERLEAEFVRLASERGSPRDLLWRECQWLESVTFGRGIDSGLLTAFVGVLVRFEVADDEDADDYPEAALLREGVALFHYRSGRWGTGGRVFFNMSPADALERLTDHRPVDS